MSYYIYMLIICISKLIDIIYNNKYVIESIIQVKRYVYNSNNSYMILISRSTPKHKNNHRCNTYYVFFFCQKVFSFWFFVNY